jgi:hypothetical protein
MVHLIVPHLQSQVGVHRRVQARYMHFKRPFFGMLSQVSNVPPSLLMGCMPMYLAAVHI